MRLRINTSGGQYFYLRKPPRNECGYVLIPVVLMLAVIASVFYLNSLEGTIGANAVGRELDAMQARAVAEAGYTEAKWQLGQNTSCTGYADLGATPFGPHSYSVSIAPTNGSPVVMTATGTMTSGAKSVLAKSVSSYQASQVLLLQPGGSGEDTYLRDGVNQNNNFGISDMLRVNNASAEETTLLRFDASSLPLNSKVISATLTLHLQGGNDLTNGVLDIHRITRSWFEGNENGAAPTTAGATYEQYDGSDIWADWNTPGGDYDPVPIDTMTIPTLAVGAYQWDVSDVVRGWASGTQTNFGLLLRASAGNVDKIEFRSSDHSGSGTHPKLTITYACECGKVCSASGMLPSLFVSATDTTTLAGQLLKKGDVAEYDLTADTASIYFDDHLINSKSLEGVHRLANGHLLISGAATTIRGLNFGAGDLIKYDPDTDSASLYFNELLFSGPVDVNAVYSFDNGHLLLSTAAEATLGGLTIQSGDLVEYDPTANTSTLYFDGALFSASEDIDGVHVLENGHLLLSTRGDATLGGLSFTDTDLIEYDPIADEATIFASIFEPGANPNALSIADGSGSIPPVPPKPAFCEGTFLDSLHTESYVGSDGNSTWATDWLEIGENDGAESGDVRVKTSLGNYRLQVQDNDSGGEGIQREVNLSAYVEATLSFTYQRDNLDDVNDYATVEVSNDGGTSWVEIDRFVGPADDSAPIAVDYEINSYIAFDTRIRFLGSSTLGKSDRIYFDNIMICAD